MELISQMIRISEVKGLAPPALLPAILSPLYLGVGNIRPSLGLSEGVRSSYRSQNLTFPLVSWTL